MLSHTGENPAEEVERIVNLRKAICNKNLYGLFRMAEGTDVIYGSHHVQRSVECV